MMPAIFRKFLLMSYGLIILLILLAIACIAIALVFYMRARRLSHALESAESTSLPGYDDDGLSTEQRARGMCIYMQDLVKQIGCEPEETAEDTFCFKYQGEHFVAKCAQRTCTVIDPCWLSVNANQFVDIEIWREAAAIVNSYQVMTIVTVPTDEDGWMFSTWYDMLIHPHNNENPEYLRSVLNTFFDVKQRLKSVAEARKNTLLLASVN